MALAKTITVNRQVLNNATAPTAVSFTAEAVVRDGNLVTSNRLDNPGVFTAGTPLENNASNPQP